MHALRRLRRRVALATILVVGGAALPPAVSAKVFLGRKQAIELAFPDADRVEDRTEILSSAQAKEIERRSRAELPSKLVRIYTGRRGDLVQGYAFVDVGLVRTKEQALLVVLTAEGDVRSVRILAFHEPLDYLPSERWFEQFAGKQAGDPLRPGHDVHAVVNATLSTRAVSDAVRRSLAIYQVVVAPRAGDQKGEPGAAGRAAGETGGDASPRGGQ